MMEAAHGRPRRARSWAWKPTPPERARPPRHGRPLTVRDVEKIVADWGSARREGRVKTAPRKDRTCATWKKTFSSRPARGSPGAGQGQGWIRLAFYSLDDPTRSSRSSRENEAPAVRLMLAALLARRCSSRRPQAEAALYREKP